MAIESTPASDTESGLAAINRISIITADRKQTLLGPSAGPESTGTVRLNPCSSEINGFYGFVSESDVQTGYLTSLAII